MLEETCSKTVSISSGLVRTASLTRWPVLGEPAALLRGALAVSFSSLGHSGGVVAALRRVSCALSMKALISRRICRSNSLSSVSIVSPSTSMMAGVYQNSRHRKDSGDLKGNLQHPVALVGEEVIGVDDLLQRVAVGDHRAEVQAAAVDDLHQPAHALLAAGAERGDDAVDTEARREGVQRHGQVLGVDPQARQGAARLDHPQRLLEGLLQPQRLDGGVHAAPAGELEDLGDHVHLE